MVAVETCAYGPPDRIVFVADLGRGAVIVGVAQTQCPMVPIAPTAQMHRIVEFGATAFVARGDARRSSAQCLASFITG